MPIEEDDWLIQPVQTNSVPPVPVPVERCEGSSWYFSWTDVNRRLTPPEISPQAPLPSQIDWSAWQSVSPVATRWESFSINRGLLKIWDSYYRPGSWGNNLLASVVEENDFSAPYDQLCFCNRCLLYLVGAYQDRPYGGGYSIPGTDPIITPSVISTSVVRYRDVLATLSYERDQLRSRARQVRQQRERQALRVAQEAERQRHIDAGHQMCSHCMAWRETPEEICAPGTICMPESPLPICVQCRTQYCREACEACDLPVPTWARVHVRLDDGPAIYGAQCADRELEYCHECDSWFRPEPDRQFHCLSRRSLIHNYSYTPSLEFRATPDDGPAPLFGELDRRRYLGMELEVLWHQGQDELRAAEHAYERAGTDLIYLKEDGSVDGWEMVTHPMTYRWAMESFPWPMLQELDEMGGATSPSVGIHVHVAKAAFARASHDYRWLMFWHRNQVPLIKLARRNSTEWAAFNPDDRRNLVKIAKKDPGMRHLGRYRAINTTPEHTYEVRVFRSSLNVQKVQASLGLVDATVEYARLLDAQKVIKGAGWEWPTFARWVKAQGDLYLPLYKEMTRLELV